ncbi:MAG: heme exporter protein CcmD [Alphaproteobacteria bacterium]
MSGIDLGQHAAFIWASYLVSLIVLGGLIIWLRLDANRQVKLLANLEARGVTRRSARKPAKGAKKATR